MIRSATIITLLFYTLSVSAQRDTSFRLLKTMNIEVSELAVDHLDNLYLLTSSEQLKKYSANGDSLAVFNNIRRFGKLHSFDVSNPLRPLLFYKDFSTVVLLDRQLSLRSTVDLRRQNILQASAASTSYDNAIWIFDAIENKLKKIRDNGELLMETADFRTIFDASFVPEKIMEHENSVYLITSSGTVLQFDYYGTFQKKYELPGWQNMSLLNKNIAGITKGGIALFNTANLMLQQQYQFPSSFGSFDRYLIGNHKIFAHTKDSINIYSFRFH